MPGSRSNPTQRIQNCPFIRVPNNPFSLSLIENTKEQSNLWISNIRSFLLALPAPCGLILPVVPEPQLALMCPVCPTVVELTCSSGSWGHRKMLTRGFGLSEHNRHFHKAVLFGLVIVWLCTHSAGPAPLIKEWLPPS